MYTCISLLVVVGTMQSGFEPTISHIWCRHCCGFHFGPSKWFILKLIILNVLILLIFWIFFPLLISPFFLHCRARKESHASEKESGDPTRGITVWVWKACVLLTCTRRGYRWHSTERGEGQLRLVHI